MTEQSSPASYFPRSIQISARSWRSLDLGGLSRRITELGIPPIIFYRQLALKLNQKRPAGPAVPVHAGQLNLFATLQKVYRFLIDTLAEAQTPGLLAEALRRAGFNPVGHEAGHTTECFVELFPPDEVLAGSADTAAWLGRSDTAVGRRRLVLRELLLLRMAAENPAIDSFREILADHTLAASSSYLKLVGAMDSALARGPLLAGLGLTLCEALRAPIKASPDSLAGQVGFIRDHWHVLLPPELLAEVAVAFDILLEEEREWGWGGEPGPPPIMEFGPGRHGGGGGASVFGGYDYPEYERFSPDADWMSNVVMMAKMAYVWLDQLGRQYGHPIDRLDQVPDAELDQLAAWGFTGLWLIGVWERSPASQRIKQLCGNPEALASAYSLYDYEIAADLGGWEALANLRERAARRGIRLASDMVPNHTGIYSRWVLQHPDWFVQTDYPPFPTYQFNGEDLSHDPDVCLQVEDGYWTKSDAAVVFKRHDRRDGRTRYIYHGNDGTSIPWNDTAQLNYLLPEVREAVIQTILHVARNFPIIRFDAAMTLAKKHYQRLWYPQPGLGSGVPSRAEHGMGRDEFDAAFPEEFWREVVDRVAAEAPDTLLLAEAFWLMEGYFVRTLGMHRVYNSAFMNMLKMEENAKYRQTLKNVLEFDPEILKRFVNFMNNPDERTAVEQFGKEGKYFGACVLLVTMPGLPMVGHGQIEGFHEKYGMEYRRAYWDEPVDEHMVRMHEEKVFPLMRRRWLFSGSDNFVFYDFFAGDQVNEDVFAYSNRQGTERGVILYHNRFAETAGWIRTSTAIAVKDGTGEMVLVQKTLGSALGFNPDGRFYYAFRDYASGLEYLRPGRELCEKGLFVELAAFEYHAFLDFREIVDDDYGTWGQLCHNLAGSGVASVDEEVKQVRFKGVLDLVRLLLAHRPIRPAGEAAVAAEERFQAFLEALAGHVGGRERVGEIAAAVGRELEFLSALAAGEACGEDAAPRKLAMQAISGHNELQVVAVAWLFLHRVGMLNEKSGWETRSAEILHEFGLERAVAEALYASAGGEDAGPPPLAVTDAVILLRLMVRWQGFYGAPESERLQMLFEDPLVQQFCLVHVSDGCRWCNKERLEFLLHGLFLAALVCNSGELPAGAREPSAVMINLYRETSLLLQLAAEAGYRLDAYLNPATAGNEAHPG